MARLTWFEATVQTSETPSNHRRPAATAPGSTLGVVLRERPRIQCLLLSACNPGSVAQERLDDAGDMEAGLHVDGTELMYQAFSVDRSQQLALDVAGFVESILTSRLQFDMERESSPGCRQGCHDHEGERRSERIRWA